MYSLCARSPPDEASTAAPLECWPSTASPLLALLPDARAASLSLRAALETSADEVDGSATEPTPSKPAYSNDAAAAECGCSTWLANDILRPAARAASSKKSDAEASKKVSPMYSSLMAHTMLHDLTCSSREEGGEATQSGWPPSAPCKSDIHDALAARCATTSTADMTRTARNRRHTSCMRPSAMPPLPTTTTRRARNRCWPRASTVCGRGRSRHKKQGHEKEWLEWQRSRNNFVYRRARRHGTGEPRIRFPRTICHSDDSICRAALQRGTCRRYAHVRPRATEFCLLTWASRRPTTRGWSKRMRGDAPVQTQRRS